MRSLLQKVAKDVKKAIFTEERKGRKEEMFGTGQEQAQEWRRRIAASVPASLRSLRPSVQILIFLLSTSSVFGLDLRVTRTQWLGVAGQEPVPSPSVSRVKAADDVVESFSLTFPSVELAEVVTSEGTFTRVSMPTAGVSAEAGAPELPVYRRQISVDPAGTYTCRATVDEQDAYDLGKQEVPRLVLPSRRAIPKVPGAREAAALGLDPAKYAQWSGPLEAATLRDLGVANGRRLLLIEVYPVAYDAVEGRITHRKRIKVEVFYTRDAKGAKNVDTLRDLGDLERSGCKGPSSNRLLIVAADSLVASLSGFVTHKRNRGWAVDVVGTSETGTAPEEIRGHIHARYLLDELRPSHLLLVGDSDTLPVWPGQGAYTPDTDLYYVCMDGNDDWLPDMAYGRLPARTPAQLSNMIERVIYYESYVSNLLAFVSNAAFSASSDNYTVTEGTHNAVIDRHMVPRAYASDKLYSYTYGATKTQVTAALNGGRGLMTYSGHAYAHKWRDPAFEISDVYALTNAFQCPLVASFACDSGSFATMDECFAEAWLRTGGEAGAVAVLASSEDSYWEEDDIFEKSLFAAIFEDRERMLGDAVLQAKQRYLAYYGPNSETLQYFEQYNLLGDPTLTLAVLDGNSNGDLAGAIRDLPDGCLKTSEIFGVTVQVSVTNPAPSALILKEKLPTGWSVSDAMWNGSPMAPTFAAGEYKWLFGVGTPVGSGTLTYNTRADGQTGQIHTITGTLLYGSTTVSTLGDQEVRMCAVIDTDADGIPDNWEIAYGLNPTNDGDAVENWDTDSLNNLQEYLADTNPTNAGSALRIIGIGVSNGTVSIRWQGGVHAIQYLEKTEDLSDASPWTCRHILVPPSGITNAWYDPLASRGSNRYYRVRAVR